MNVGADVNARRCARDLPFILVHSFQPSASSVCTYQLTCGDTRPLAVLPCPLLSPIRGAGWRWVAGHLCPGYPSLGALCCLHPVAQSQNPYWAHLPTRLGCGYSTFPGLRRPRSDIHDPNLSLDPWYYFMITLKPTYTFVYKLFIKFFSVTQFENARCFLPECD